MQEALNMTSEEMDVAAHQIMLQERHSASGETKPANSPSSKSPNKPNSYEYSHKHS